MALTFWAFGIVFLVAGIAWGGWIAKTEIRPRWRWLFVLMASCLAFAVYEAAGFHTGPQAAQWFAVAMSALLGSCLLFSLTSHRRAQNDR
jgi:hypothetical protein